MQDTEKISGNRILALFDQLQKTRTVINLKVLGKDFERLTIITGMISENGSQYLLLDYPAGFREEAPAAEGLRLFLEFLGEDKIPYAFRSSLKKMSQNDLWIEVPQYVERIQRRRYFRIAPPLGTRVNFIKDTKAYSASVVNVSVGGAMINPGEKGVRKSKFFTGDEIRDLEILCQEEFTRVRIVIKKAVVRRVQSLPETGKNHIALEFQDTGNREKYDLEEWIYRCQREVLRKRSLMT